MNLRCCGGYSDGASLGCPPRTSALSPQLQGIWAADTSQQHSALGIAFGCKELVHLK